MNLFKSKTVYLTNDIEYIHDKLCENNPCICRELDIVRHHRRVERAQNEARERMKLAEIALDGEQ